MAKTMEPAMGLDPRRKKQPVTLSAVSDTNIDNVTHMEFVTVKVGPKSRVVLPAGLRRAAGIEEGSELVGYVDAYGRLVLETAESARDRVWAAAPETEGDSIAEVRAQRVFDVTLEAAKLERRAKAPRDDDAGERLLRELGLS